MKKCKLCDQDTWCNASVLCLKHFEQDWKIDSKKILYSKWNNDECYTPAYWVEPIIKYIDTFKAVRWLSINNWQVEKTYSYEPIIWCPFDKIDSEFVKQITNAGYQVICSHIDEWKDFFEYEPREWDIIISNPPFTNKRKYFERALSFWKPFALIMTNTWLNDAAPKQLFKDKQLQLLMFDKRMKFISPDGRDNNKITFSSSYYCYNFLPRDLIMEELTFKQ